MKHMSGWKKQDMACVTAVTVHGPLSPTARQQWLWERGYKIKHNGSCVSHKPLSPTACRAAGCKKPQHPPSPPPPPGPAQLTPFKTHSSEEAAVGALSFEFLHPSGVFTRIRPAYFKKLKNAYNFWDLQVWGQSRTGHRGGWKKMEKVFPALSGGSSCFTSNTKLLTDPSRSVK